MLKFLPPLNENMKTPEFRAYMVETAWDYYVIAHKGTYRRGYIETSLSCLSLEILLKSFNADIAKNKGQINEMYRPNDKVRKLGKKSHDLMELYGLLDREYQTYLFNESDLSTLARHSNFFSSTRYGYEPDVPSVFHDSISKLAAASICKVIYLYKVRGCNDPFIVNFNLDEVYFSDVQKVLFYVEK